MPTSSAMMYEGSLPAMSSTRSHSPRSDTSSRMARTVSAIESRQEVARFGVNTAPTSRR